MVIPWTANMCRNPEQLFAAARANQPEIEKLQFHLQ